MNHYPASNINPHEGDPSNPYADLNLHGASAGHPTTGPREGGHVGPAAGPPPGDSSAAHPSSGGYPVPAIDHATGARVPCSPIHPYPGYPQPLPAHPQPLPAHPYAGPGHPYAVPVGAPGFAGHPDWWRDNYYPPPPPTLNAPWTVWVSFGFTVALSLAGLMVTLILFIPDARLDLSGSWTVTPLTVVLLLWLGLGSVAASILAGITVSGRLWAATSLAVMGAGCFLLSLLEMNIIPALFIGVPPLLNGLSYLLPWNLEFYRERQRIRMERAGQQPSWM